MVIVQLNFFNIFCDTPTQFVNLKIIICMAINLSKIKLINLKILIKHISCVCTSFETLSFSNYLSWTYTSTSSQQVQNWNYTLVKDKIISTSWELENQNWLYLTTPPP